MGADKLAPMIESAAPAVSSHAYPRLLGDVGGTNARFAWQAAPDSAIERARTLPGADYPHIEDAIRDYLRREGVAPPVACAIAIANPVYGDRVQMTNHSWGFSIEALRASLQLQRLRVLNDFTALALALPALPAQALRQVGGGQAVPGAAIGLVGAGTGLGVSGLLPDGRGAWVPLQGEGGHVGFAPETPRELAVTQVLQRRLGRVSAERVISGQGLENLYRALCELDGRDLPAQARAADISERALAGHDVQAHEALDMMCALLGSVAGDLALTLGARGGVYVGGGIVPRLGGWFDRSAFRARFEAKGRFADYLGRVPVWVVTAQTSPALLGASRALDLGA